MRRWLFFLFVLAKNEATKAVIEGMTADNQEQKKDEWIYKRSNSSSKNINDFKNIYYFLLNFGLINLSLWNSDLNSKDCCKNVFIYK